MPPIFLTPKTQIVVLGNVIGVETAGIAKKSIKVLTEAGKVGLPKTKLTGVADVVVSTTCHAAPAKITLKFDAIVHLHLPAILLYLAGSQAVIGDLLWVIPKGGASLVLI